MTQCEFIVFVTLVWKYRLSYAVLAAHWPPLGWSRFPRAYCGFCGCGRCPPSSSYCLPILGCSSRKASMEIFQYTNPFVLDIPKEWNAAVTSMGASFWHYLRARMGAAVTIHFVRNGEFTRYTIYGNAYGCLWQGFVVHLQCSWSERCTACFWSLWRCCTLSASPPQW